MKNSLPVILLLFSLVACNLDELDFDNLQTPTLRSRVAIPIGEVSYTLRELLEEVDDQAVLLEEDSNSMLKLTYYDTARFESGEEIIRIENVSNSANVTVPLLTAGSERREELVDTVFLFEYKAEKNEAIDSVFYKEGEMELIVTSNLASDIHYDIDIANTQKVINNEPIRFSGDVAGYAVSSGSRDLSGYKTKLLFREGKNTFQVSTRITVFLDAGETTNPDEFVNVTLTYRDQTFRLIYGKFGQDTVSIGHEILNIQFFEDLGESGFKFGNPEFIFDFHNGFGVPMGIVFSNIYGVDNTSTGLDTTYLEGPATSTPQVIAGSDGLGMEATSEVLLNAQNSTLRDLLSKSPRTIGLALTAITNPEDAYQSNFILDTSRITSYIEVSLPMELSLRNVEEKVDFSLGGGLKFDEADTASIRIVSENELPFSVRLKMDIVDENDSVLYTIPQTLVMESPFINSDGIVTQSRQLIADVPLSKAGIEALGIGDKLKLTFILNSPAGGSRDVYVKVLADYMLNVSVSALGRLNLKL